MAKIRLNSLIKDVRNRMGNVVFSKWKKTNYVRIYVKPSAKPSPKQLERRRIFAALVAQWKSTTDSERSLWNLSAVNKNMSGFNAFLSFYMKQNTVPNI